MYVPQVSIYTINTDIMYESRVEKEDEVKNKRNAYKNAKTKKNRGLGVIWSALTWLRRMAW